MHGSKLELHVSQDENVVGDEQQEQTELLKHQLKIRDQLVDQLSAQLFQMVQDHPPALPQARSSFNGGIPNSASEDVQALQQQISFYQDQIDQRDQQITQLKTSCQELSDRNHMLENVIQELPEVYRQQFAERLDRFKEKMQALKAENQKLRTELGLKSKNNSGKTKRRLFLPSQKQG